MTLTLKIAFVGPPESGKTWLTTYFCNKPIPSDYESTIGAGFYEKSLEADWPPSGLANLHLKAANPVLEKNNNSTSLKIQLWDTSGLERFSMLLPNYIQGAHLVYLVCDMNRVTGEVGGNYKKSIIEFYENHLKEYEKNKVFQKLCLIGSKADLLTAESFKKATQELHTLANCFNIPVECVITTSVKAKSDVDKLLLKTIANAFQLNLGKDDNQATQQTMPAASTIKSKSTKTPPFFIENYNKNFPPLPSSGFTLRGIRK